jgi:hypothetical protein
MNNIREGVDSENSESISASAASERCRDSQLPENGPGESLASLTGGLPPEEIEEIRQAQALIPAYQLLQGLIGRNERDFVVRAAALEGLVASGRASFSLHDVDEVLYWLRTEVRESIVRVLRDAGWTEYKAGLGEVVTDQGRAAFEVLQLLRRKLESGELLPTVASLEHALNVGASPFGLLNALLLKLNQDYAEVEDALASHSEIVLRNTARKIEEALSHSRKINALLDRVPKDSPQTWTKIREIHDQLSRLHPRLAELHSAISEVGRQYLRLIAGLTTQQIVEALIRKRKDLLARVGHEALLSALAAPPLLNTDVLGYRATAHFTRERIRAERMTWEEPPEVQYEPRAGEEVPPEIAAFLGELRSVADGSQPVPFRELIPRSDKMDSFLRASLLPLAGDRSADGGVAGRFSVLSLDVEAEGDGWPEGLSEGPVESLTPGTVRPTTLGRKVEGERG